MLMKNNQAFKMVSEMRLFEQFPVLNIELLIHYENIMLQRFRSLENRWKNSQIIELSEKSCKFSLNVIK